METTDVADFTYDLGGKDCAAAVGRLDGMAGFVKQSGELFLKLGNLFVKLEQPLHLTLHHPRQERIASFRNVACPISESFQGKGIFECRTVRVVPKPVEDHVELVLESGPLVYQILPVHGYILDLLGFLGFIGYSIWE